MNRAKTKARSLDDRFFCSRLTCEMSGRDCVVYRGAGRCISCQSCPTGEQHTLAFGQKLFIPEIRHCPVATIQKQLRRKKIPKAMCGVRETVEVRDAIKAIAQERGYGMSKEDLFSRIGVSSWFFYKTPWSTATMETCRAWLQEKQGRKDLLEVATDHKLSASEKFSVVEMR